MHDSVYYNMDMFGTKAAWQLACCHFTLVFMLPIGSIRPQWGSGQDILTQLTQSYPEGMGLPLGVRLATSWFAYYSAAPLQRRRDLLSSLRVPSTYLPLPATGTQLHEATQVGTHYTQIGIQLICCSRSSNSIMRINSAIAWRPAATQPCLTSQV